MNALTIHTLDAEPRVLDTDLGERLGMAQPRFIRADLIKANRAELETYGTLMEAPSKSGKRGRPATAFYLNEEQALIVCMFSRTPKAQEVRREVVTVFTAWRRGTPHQRPVHSIPQTLPEALRLAADESERADREEARRKIAEAEAEAVSEKLSGPRKAGTSYLPIHIYLEAEGLENAFAFRDRVRLGQIAGGVSREWGAAVHRDAYGRRSYLEEALDEALERFNRQFH